MARSTSPAERQSDHGKIAEDPATPVPTAKKTAEKVPVPAKKPRPRKKSTRKKKPSKKPPIPGRRIVLLAALEALGLLFSLLTAVVVVLGSAAGRYSGTDFFSHLLPFTLGVTGLILIATLLLLGWLRLRRWLHQRFVFAPAALAIVLALGVGSLALRGEFFFAISQFRILVGGKEEAARVTLTHQVYAAYRRLDNVQEQQLVDRSRAYTGAIDAAATSYQLDPDLLHGIAATESSFLPRDSRDGGKGLFQITQVPQAVLRDAADRLGVPEADTTDHRHNAFIAAGTLNHYLSQMNNDLFLGLLAYNIGPKNGGLRFIMQQYGATDFVTIQPYLQQLPRDYPIRVLSHALAFRLHRTMNQLPAYEEGLNAVRIQHLGIPGL
jgi:hypothetical protein